MKDSLGKCLSLAKPQHPERPNNGGPSGLVCGKNKHSDTKPKLGVGVKSGGIVFTPICSPTKTQQGLARPSGSPDSAHTDAQGQTKSGIRMGRSAEGVPGSMWLGKYYSSQDPNLQRVLVQCVP